MTSSKKVAFLGPLGTYSHDAATRAFPDESCNWSPQSSLRDCMEKLWKGEVEYAVMPFENSTNGSVVYTLDILRDLYHGNGQKIDENHLKSNEKYQVLSDVYVPINHCLISHNQQLNRIERVYSHPQAWGQCDVWYEKHLKGVEKIDVSSTSKAVEMAKKDEKSAAIAGRAAAKVHEMPVQVADISNNSNNTTRFLVFGLKSALKGSGSNSSADSSANSHVNYHTLISFTVEHSIPGALCKALSVFGKQSLNMTQICSRPSGKEPWTYVFFVEIEGNERDFKVNEALKELKDYCLEITILGSLVHST